jgi:TonB family protein
MIDATIFRCFSGNSALVARCVIGLSLLIAGTSAAWAEYEPAHVDQSCPTPPPVVGDSAAVNHEHGTVGLGIYVNSRGRPKKIRVTQSSGYNDLDNAAVAAVAGWHYTPAVRNGGYVSDWMGLKIEFGQRETGTTLRAPTPDQVEACSD